MPAFRVKLDDKAKLPEKHSPRANGYDLYAAAGKTIKPGATELVKTGVHLQSITNCPLPGFDWDLQIRPRSGLAKKHNISVRNTPGSIDPDYIGEIGVLLHNGGEEDYVVKKGDRIAQLMFGAVCNNIELRRVAELKTTERSAGGFGSTGI